MQRRNGVRHPVIRQRFRARPLGLVATVALFVGAGCGGSGGGEEPGPAAGAESVEAPVVASKPNIVVIVLDDFNHWARHLGRNPQARTPNIDGLAARGVTFTSAYAAAPLCNPSRTAMFSGARPSTSGIYQNSQDWRPQFPPNLMMPQHFRNNGYYVAGAGKIYHSEYDRKTDYDDYAPYPTTGTPAACANGGTTTEPGPNWGASSCPETSFYEHKNASFIIDKLNQPRTKPFMLMYGSFHPHVDWYAPKRFYDQFPLETINLPPFKADDLADVPPQGVRFAHTNGSSHAAIQRFGNWNKLVRAYLANQAFADYEAGRVIDAIQASPHANNTIIVLFGDHGWHLGEKDHWMKSTLWEEGTRVPFVWYVPGRTPSGVASPATVDLLSLYPTLAQLAGIPVPAHVEGRSIANLLAAPTGSWSFPALSTFEANNHAIRRGPWRYIRYHDRTEELYNHTNDPFEWTNVASNPANATIKSQLAAQMPPIAP